MSGERMLSPAELLANLYDAALKKGKKFHLTLTEANMKEIGESLNQALMRAMKEMDALHVLADAIIHTNNMGGGFEINGEKAVLVPYDELRTVMDRVPSPVSQAVPQRIDQTVIGAKGNCFSACLAMVLGISLSEVPNFCDAPGFDEDPGSAFMAAAKEWLAARGWGHITIDAPGRSLQYSFPRGYLIVGGMTSRGRMHSVVYKDGQLWHDPHPSREGLIEPKDVDLVFPLNPAALSAPDLP